MPPRGRTAGAADRRGGAVPAASLTHWLREETGYQWIQGTKPQTLAYGLTDSPVGLAAWIVEKFRTWSDCGGDVERRFSKDELLTNVMLYWVTGAINSSFWPYYARRHGDWPMPDSAPIAVPTAYLAFPREIVARRARWPSASSTSSAGPTMPARRPLRGAGGAGSAGRRHAGLLPRPPLLSALKGS